jgi:exonuclease SbcC
MKGLFNGLERRFDFESGAVAIVGPNGSGKSSIIEGIFLALFGETLSPKFSADYIATTGRKGELRFRFSRNGREFEVEREFRLSKKGTVTQRAALYELSSEGERIGLATDPNAVNERIALELSPWIKGKGGRDLVKQVRNAFAAAAIIPQGNITRFLDMTPSERWEIFGAAFGLDEVNELRSRASEMVALAESRVRDLLARREYLHSRLESLPPAEVLRSRLREAESKEGELRKTLHGAEKLVESVRFARALRTDMHRLREEIPRIAAELERTRTLRVAGTCVSGLAAVRDAAAATLPAKSALTKNERELEERRLLAAELRRSIAKKEEEVREIEGKIRSMERDASFGAPAAELLTLRKEYAALAGSPKANGSDGAIAAAKAALRESEKRCLLLQAAVLQRALEENGKKLFSVRSKHVVEAQRLAEAVRDVESRLQIWLRVLAGGKETITVSDIQVRDERTLRALRESGLDAALNDLGRRKGTCLSFLAEGRRLREERKELMAEMEAIPLPENAKIPDIALNGESLAMEERRRETLRGDVAAKCARLSEIIKRGEVLAASLPPQVKANPSEYVRLSEALAALGKTYREQSEALRGLGESLAAAERVCTILEGAIRQASDRLAAAKERLADSIAAWKRTVVSLSGGPAELSRILRYDKATKFPAEEDLTRLAGKLAGCERALEENEGKLELLERNVWDAAAFLRQRGVPSERTEEQNCEALLSDLRGEHETMIRFLAEQSRDLRERETAERDYEQVLAAAERAAPAYETAKRLAQLSDGKNFITFALSNILDHLSNSVNHHLREAGVPYRLFSQDGQFRVRDVGAGGEERTRAAASLSGGEKSLVSILLIRENQRRMRFSELLWVDEGLAFLDTASIESVTEALIALGEMDGRVVGCVMHDPMLADIFPKKWELYGGARKHRDGMEGLGESGAYHSIDEGGMERAI